MLEFEALLIRPVGETTWGAEQLFMLEELEPEAGFEPAAYALRVRCSTPELPRRKAG